MFIVIITKIDSPLVSEKERKIKVKIFSYENEKKEAEEYQKRLESCGIYGLNLSKIIVENPDEVQPEEDMFENRDFKIFLKTFEKLKKEREEAEQRRIEEEFRNSDYYDVGFL